MLSRQKISSGGFWTDPGQRMMKGEIDNESIAENSSLYAVTACLAENIQINGCSFFPSTGPILSVIQSRSITISGGTIPAGADPLVRVIGGNSREIRIKGIDKTGLKNPVESGKDARPDAVHWE